MIRTILLTLVFLLAFPGLTLAQAQSSTPSNCAALVKNLRLGMKGPDVLLLQQILNKNPLTTIDASGPGSPGQETEYFGLKTQRAIIKFQDLYRSEVLTPVGLKSGSGFVGSYTRGKLQSLCVLATVKPASSIPSPQATSTTSKTPLATTTPKTSTTTTSPAVTSGQASDVFALSLTTPSSFTSATPVIMFPSTYTANRGTKMSITGIAFTATGNVVHLGTFLIASTTLSKGGILEFTIPSDAPFGKHELWITNSNGTTNKTFLIVTDPNNAPPVVTGFTPKEGFYQTEVTITGTGFLASGNEIRTSYGLITDVASLDGKTLKFVVTPPGLAELSPGEDRPEFDIVNPIGFYVFNANGISGASVFNMKI